MALRSFFPVLLGIVLLASCSVKDESLNTDSRRAEKKFKKAEKAFKERGRSSGSRRRRSRKDREEEMKERRETIRENLKKAIELDPDFLEARLLLAEFHRERGNKEKAFRHYRFIAEEDPSFHPKTLIRLGWDRLLDAEYAEADSILTRYHEMRGTDPSQEERAQLLLASAKFAQKALKDSVPFDPKNLGEGVNSKYPEYFPCLTVDQRTILFTRRIPSQKNPDFEHEDFFSSVKVKGEWQRARNMEAPINTIYNEGAPTLSPDGNLLIFTACAMGRGYGPDRRGKGSCDLFATKKVGDRWVDPQNLGEPINTQDWESQPSIAPDGKTLYFVRGKVTMQGAKEQDIYKSELQGDGEWSEPEKLSSTVNTPYREESVFIHPDGRTLYFSSNGHPGMGGLDIFVTKKQKDGSWSEPENLGYPINTENDENSLMVAPDGEHAYFGSDREGGYGKLDLYRFELPDRAKADPVTYLRGKLMDAESGEPISAEFKLKDLENGELITRSRSDQEDGTFLVPLPSGRRYALSVDKKDYLFHSEHFMMEEGEGRDKPVEKDIELQPIDTGKSVVLENVFFETAKYDLKKESRVELDKLYRFLEEHPSIKIEIQGHTDSIGTKKDNQVLSENRAKAVYEYLHEKGVSKDRMIAKGYGEERPIAPNSTKEGRARNRRTAYEIIEQ